MIKCLKCGKEYSKNGIYPHFWRNHTKNGCLFKSNIIGLKIGNPWSKGLKKETDIRIKKISDNMKLNKLNNKITGKASTLKLEKERRKKISKNGKGKIGGYRRRSGRGKSGWYSGYWCDSSWELAFVIYNIEHNIIFFRNIEKFYYEFNNEIKKYIPDFILNNEYIEIKGYETKQTNAKTKFFPHKLKIIKKEEMKPILKYVISKYGINFIKLYDKFGGVAESG